MNVLLIQTSGASISTADPAYIREAEGPRYCDEPLEHQRYFNAEPYWKQGFLRRRAWQSASEGDKALLYCTGSVDEYPSRLSHILTIGEKRIVPDEGAWLEFSDVEEISPAIEYSRIQTLIDQGAFSEGMEECGREGFNIRPVDQQDLRTVR
jgi:hypothetical protein